jgi:regulator of protease activity HflC (stomatin/prohibitin superfamily)
MTEAANIVLFIFLIGIVVFTILNSFGIVQQYEKGIILRLGKYNSLRHPGLVLLVPFVDKLRRVDMREKNLTFSTAMLQVTVYYKVVDPAKYLFEVAAFEASLTRSAQNNTNKFTDDKAASSVGELEQLVSSALEATLSQWGTKLVRVEMQRIAK